MTSTKRSQATGIRLKQLVGSKVRVLQSGACNCPETFGVFVGSGKNSWPFLPAASIRLFAGTDVRGEATAYSGSMPQSKSTLSSERACGNTVRRLPKESEYLGKVSLAGSGRVSFGSKSQIFLTSLKVLNVVIV